MSKQEGKQKKQSSELNDKIIEWIEKLSIHFNQPQDEEQIKIFLHALRRNTPYQIEEAFDRCLSECEFMPRLADVHKRMPEQRWPPENPGAFVLSGPPTMELVREIAREMFPSYDQLEGKDLHDAAAAANKERYRRMSSS
jgi:hypothetical protein